MSPSFFKNSKFSELERLLAEREQECESLRTELSDVKTRLRAEEEKVAASFNAMTESRQALADSQKELEDTRKALETAQLELSEMMDIQIDFEAFEKKLSSFEQVKQNYEKIIADLKAKLKDAERIPVKKKEMGDYQEDFEHHLTHREDVETKKNISFPSILFPEFEEEAEDRNDDVGQNSVIQPETDIKKTEKKTPVWKERRAPGLPTAFPTPSDNDDWAVALPDDL